MPETVGYIYGKQVILCESMVNRRQARTHRQRRINKKWLKRYGTLAIPKKEILMICDRLFMHPTIWKILEEVRN